MTSTNGNEIHKNECLKSIKALNKNLKNAEKDRFSNIPNIKENKEFQIVYEIYLSNESNINGERHLQAQKLGQISKLIKNFQLKSKSLTPSQDSIELIKRLMEEIDSEISNLKEEHRLKYEEYANDEKLLTKEIEIYEKKITNWTLSNESENNINKFNNQKDLNSDKINECDLLKEVIDFDKYILQNGGHNGGWDLIDHNLFLKIRNKHKAKQPNFLNELERLIATKNMEQIVQHEEWYKKYLNLKDLKKEAIKKWKENKSNAKNESVSLAEAEIKLNHEIEKELKNRFEKQKLLEKQQRNKQLNEWRIEREIRKAQEIEMERRKEEMRTEKELKRRLKQEEMKEKVKEYKKQKEELNEYIEMEQFVMKEAEKEFKSKEIKEEIEKFQQRDFENLKWKLAKTKAKEEEKEEKQKRLDKMKEKFEVEHDPSRLYQMTTIWKNRLNTPRTESCGPVITPRIPHLTVPTWRQGV